MLGSTKVIWYQNINTCTCIPKIRWWWIVINMRNYEQFLQWSFSICDIAQIIIDVAWYQDKRGHFFFFLNIHCTYYELKLQKSSDSSVNLIDSQWAKTIDVHKMFIKPIIPLYKMYVFSSLKFTNVTLVLSQNEIVKWTKHFI